MHGEVFHGTQYPARTDLQELARFVQELQDRARSCKLQEKGIGILQASCLQDKMCARLYISFKNLAVNGKSCIQMNICKIGTQHLATFNQVLT